MFSIQIERRPVVCRLRECPHFWGNRVLLFSGTVPLIGQVTWELPMGLIVRKTCPLIELGFIESDLVDMLAEEMKAQCESGGNMEISDTFLKEHEDE